MKDIISVVIFIVLMSFVMVLFAMMWGPDDVNGFKMTPELEKEKILLNKCITADHLDSPKCDKVYGGNVTHGNNEVPFP